MATGFKNRFYKSYRSTHNNLLYGVPNIADIQRKFSTWKYYYGKLLPTLKSAHILDVGCGEGAFVYFLQEQGFVNVRGIDVSLEQVEAADQLGIHQVVQADASDFLSRPENKFDVIIARDVIEHFPRDEAFDLLQKIFEALRPGGTFIMQVPNGQGLFYTSIFYGDYTHEIAYTESSVRQVFLNAGFRRVMCFPTGPVPHSLFGLLRIFFWWLKVKHTQFWKMVETGNPNGIFTSNLIAKGEKA
jgi:2-polyprenyl-3-methyl-5-hydroxy-6-metoxy-1,4-benzoquinol methylase